MNQKGLAPILIILILASIAVGLTIYRNQERKTTISESIKTTATVSESVEWKTYSGDKYSFNYPPDWVVTTSDYLNSKIITNEKDKVKITFSDDQYPFGFGDPNAEVKTEELKVVVDEKEYTVEEVTINDSLSFINFKTDSPNIVYIYITNDKGPNYQKSKDSYIKILSSFKFNI